MRKLFLLTASLTIIFSFSLVWADFGPEILTPAPLILKKQSPSLDDKTRAFLNAQGDNVKIWVFFTDKGVMDQPQFEKAASQITINSHAHWRRSKVGMSGPVFADLPVNQEYISALSNMGAKHRRSSRWLNAASFEIPVTMAEKIAALPFVYKIQPVAGYKSIEPELAPIPDESAVDQLVPQDKLALNYGQSWGQNDMIQSPVLHNLGFNGQGIVVAMLDTGYRKTHQAFQRAFSEGRVLDEWDFIFDDGDTQNELEDDASQHNHGTYTWSTMGGYYSGSLIGPGFEASFLLAKTEDVRSETPIEEDNWVAAMEWADERGADVISSSLSYTDWYEFADFDGLTAVTTLAANTAADLGIIVCTAMGNEGPGPGTLGAPADAFDILAVGAVADNEFIADFSSRGPTADGRHKPEVCAQGVATFCARGNSDNEYSFVNGTSLSTPLVAGAAAALLSARPELNPHTLRLAMMETASRAMNPGNAYGWGIVRLDTARNWGANFAADTTFGFESLTVQFSDSSDGNPLAWKWHFGDGDSSSEQNPSHTYVIPGAYDVTLAIETPYGGLAKSRSQYVSVAADTLIFENDSAFAGNKAVVSLNLTNALPLRNILIPMTYAGEHNLILDSITRGDRTDYFDILIKPTWNYSTRRGVLNLRPDYANVKPPLAPGTGEIARFYFTLDSAALPGQTAFFDTASIPPHVYSVATDWVNYKPIVSSGSLMVRTAARGDVNGDGTINVLDIVALIDNKFKGGPPPVTLVAGDANADLIINILDILYLIDYKFKGGPPPPGR